MRYINIIIIGLILASMAAIVWLLWVKKGAILSKAKGSGTKPYVIGSERIDYTIDPDKIHIPPTL